MPAFDQLGSGPAVSVSVRRSALKGTTSSIYRLNFSMLAADAHCENLRVFHVLRDPFSTRFRRLVYLSVPFIYAFVFLSFGRCRFFMFFSCRPLFGSSFRAFVTRKPVDGSAVAIRWFFAVSFLPLFCPSDPWDSCLNGKWARDDGWQKGDASSAPPPPRPPLPLLLQGR
eukprot:scaffold905_cov363-Pavlova_lutheri.AAC.16